MNKQPKNVLSLQKKSCISAKYSSKLDILRSFALSLHMIINNFNNYIFNLKDNDETNYNNRMCNCADG